MSGVSAKSLSSVAKTLRKKEVWHCILLAWGVHLYLDVCVCLVTLKAWNDPWSCWENHVNHSSFNLFLQIIPPPRRQRGGVGGGLVLPDVVVLLDVDLVKHHVLPLGIDVSFHLHGNVAGKHWEQETFLHGNVGAKWVQWTSMRGEAAWLKQLSKCKSESCLPQCWWIKAT